MSNLFNQDTFLGGLNTRLEASKLPVGQYSLLVNGRVTKNTVAPIKKHRKISTPSGKKQGLYSIGKYLLLFVSGRAYWMDISIQNSTWALLPAWTALDPTVDRIYAELVPVSYFQGSIDYTATNDPQDVKVTFPGIPSQTQSQLFITDGINQPRVVNPDGTWRVTHTYAAWTTVNPEYVPIGILPAKAGQKLYLVDTATGTKIYNSVSGRFLDFVIARAANGDKFADAENTFKSVDFNRATALFEVSDGGLFVGTLYASYVVYPDYNTTLFAEPALREQKLFPTGPVNNRSFANLNGDLAFITQTGIQSFNDVLQTQSESNNKALGALISNILVTPQNNTCATNFDIEALFAVNTVYGYGVLVYDNTLSGFISLDLDFGQVNDFAVVKYDGGQKLFFLNVQGEVYEAYASSEYSTCRIYLGDYGSYDPQSGQQLAGRQHKITAVRLQFGNVTEAFDAQISLYADREFVVTDLRTIPAIAPNTLEEPHPLPFPSHRSAYPVDFKVENSKFCWKSGVWLEWQGSAELLSILAQGEMLTQESFMVISPQNSPIQTVTMFADSKFESVIADTAAWTLQPGLEIGEYYSIVGTLHDGRKTITDSIFKAVGSEVNLLGRLAKCGNLKFIWDLMIAENPNLIIGAGDHGYDVGSETDIKQIVNLFGADSNKVYLAAGNRDLDTNSGQYLFGIRATPRMYVKSSGNTDFFILNSGYNTAGTIVESLGNTETSAQAIWLKAQVENSRAKFKVAVFHHPPYTEDDSYYPGYTNLRWPFAAWGIDMVVCGHGHMYQRFLVGNIPYIVLPPMGGVVRIPRANITSTAILRQSISGYARLRIDKYTMLIEILDENSTIIDAFGIYD